MKKPDLMGRFSQLGFLFFIGGVLLVCSYGRSMFTHNHYVPIRTPLTTSSTPPPSPCGTFWISERITEKREGVWGMYASIFGVYPMGTTFCGSSPSGATTYFLQGSVNDADLFQFYADKLTKKGCHVDGVWQSTQRFSAYHNSLHVRCRLTSGMTIYAAITTYEGFKAYAIITQSSEMGKE